MNLPTTILAATDATSHGLVPFSTAINTEGSIVSLLSSQPQPPSHLS